MEKWVLWTKTKRDDRGRNVMENSTLVYVGRRVVGEGADKTMLPLAGFSQIPSPR